MYDTDLLLDMLKLAKNSKTLSKDYSKGTKRKTSIGMVMSTESDQFCNGWAHYEPIHYFCDDVTTSFISNNVNFSNYWVELDVNTTSFVYFKSVLNSTSNCCNYPPLCNCSTEENGGEFVYDKQSKYVHSTRGKWQIKIQIDYEASLTVFLYTYGGNKLFLNTH